MPAHGHYGDTSKVRYNKETQCFELRCERCASYGREAYWPLTLEFWDPYKTMQRCRACNSAVNNMKRKRRWAEMYPDEQEKHRAQNRDYYHRNKAWLRPKQNEARRAKRAAARLAAGAPTPNTAEDFAAMTLRRVNPNPPSVTRLIRQPDNELIGVLRP